MANHASTRTTQLYDRRRDEMSLIQAADHDDPISFARISVMQAINRVERVFDPSRKDKHWGRRKLARDR
jgi:hypothetical protein